MGKEIVRKPQNQYEQEKYKAKAPLKIQYHSEQDRQWNFTVY